MKVSCFLPFFSVYHARYNAPEIETADRTAAVQFRKTTHQDKAQAA